MESKEVKERYIVIKPNPKNKKANLRLRIYDQQKQEYFTKEEALAKILNRTTRTCLKLALLNALYFLFLTRNLLQVLIFARLSRYFTCLIEKNTYLTKQISNI